MKLIVISPAAEDPREPATLAQLFAAGLTSYHLRKPTWSRAQLAAYLRPLPADFRSRLVLHTHHDLAAEFPVAGLHDRDNSEGRVGPLGPPRTPSAPHTPTGAPSVHVLPSFFRSRAVHDLPTLRASLDTYDRVLLSPIFPSFSKPGYGPSAQLPEAELRSVLALPRRAEFIALGGIDATRIAACRDLGFDGVAVLGAIWQSADPLSAFSELPNALLAHAA